MKNTDLLVESNRRVLENGLHVDMEGYCQENECRTVMCALGWCTETGVKGLEVLPSDFSQGSIDYLLYQERVFITTPEEWLFLFAQLWPNCAEQNLYRSICFRDHGVPESWSFSTRFEADGDSARIIE